MAEEEAGSAQGSAAAQAELWGERAKDWADVLEGWNGWGIPIYRHVLERISVGSNTNLLDVGCGAGRFCRIAADRGAQVAGIDATEPLLEIARERVLDGDFRVGEMEALPWADDSFDVVTGFNSFFIASDMVNALREVSRVARPGAGVAMTGFGRPDRCESTQVFAALRELVSPPPATEPEPAPDDGGEAPAGEAAPALHEEGGLESIAKQAGLTPQDGGYFEIVEEYPDLDTMLRGYLAAAPMWRAARMAGEERVRETVSEALQSLVGPDGRPRLHDELRFLIAEA
jgi:SAM-dependent methyltransferase